MIAPSDVLAADIKAVLDSDDHATSAFIVQNQSAASKAAIDAAGNTTLVGCLRVNSTGVITDECAGAGYIIADNRVGIGDATPAAALVVGSDAGITTANGAGDVYVQSDLEVDGGIYGDGSRLTNVVAVQVTSGAAPTVDAAGEIAIDTTADDLIFYGGAKRSIHYKQFHSYTVENPADTDNIMLFKAPYNLTITNINCVVDPADADGSESAVIMVQERDSAGDGPAGVDGATTITCGNAGAADDGALSNGPIDSGDWVSLDIGTVTGTVSQLAVTTTYEKTSE